MKLVDKEFSSAEEMLAFFKAEGAKGGRAAAKSMSKAARVKRAKAAGAASAKVRSKKAKNGRSKVRYSQGVRSAGDA